MKKGIQPIASCDAPELNGIVQYTGSLNARGLSCALVVSRFNTELTHGLLQAAVATLLDSGMTADAITVTWVPGAFEIPTLLEQRAREGCWDMLIALGAVLEGQTPHAQAINRGVTRSFISIARTYAVPVIDGVVCALDWDQAAQRCLQAENNRGAYAARAAIETARVMQARAPAKER